MQSSEAPSAIASICTLSVLQFGDLLTSASCNYDVIPYKDINFHILDVNGIHAKNLVTRIFVGIDDLHTVQKLYESLSIC